MELTKIHLLEDSEKYLGMTSSWSPLSNPNSNPNSNRDFWVLYKSEEYFACDGYGDSLSKEDRIKLVLVTIASDDEEKEKISSLVFENLKKFEGFQKVFEEKCKEFEDIQGILDITSKSFIESVVRGMGYEWHFHDNSWIWL